MGNSKRKKRINIPILPIERYAAASFSGRIRENTFDPSSGGIGIRLNIPRSKLSLTTINKNQFKIADIFGSKGRKISNLISKAPIAAIKKFVAGPARDTIAISFLPSLKLNPSTGTGFAAPKITGEPDSIKIKGKAILIIGSIWGLGSRVNLPKSFAVGSPSL